jgi:hypothetical protein
MAYPGYVFVPFPKAKYHPDGRTALVRDPREELALGPEWADTVFPAAQEPDVVETPLATSDPPIVPPRRRGRPRKVDV